MMLGSSLGKITQMAISWMLEFSVRHIYLKINDYQIQYRKKECFAKTLFYFVGNQRFFSLHFFIF